MSSVAREYGSAGPCPLRAARGTIAGLLAQLLVWPRTPETAARGRRKRRGCAAGLRAAASGR